MGFKVEPRKTKKLLNFILQKHRFPNICGQFTFIQLSVLPLICDLIGNSTHVHVHVQARSTKTRRKHLCSSVLPCSYFKIFSVSTNDWWILWNWLEHPLYEFWEYGFNVSKNISYSMFVFLFLFCFWFFLTIPVPHYPGIGEFNLILHITRKWHKWGYYVVSVFIILRIMVIIDMISKEVKM